jgi:hypothetical protein
MIITFPKQKAKELYSTYLPMVKSSVNKSLIAKKCALSAVAFARENPLNSDGYNNYLDQVRNEIEVL